MINQQSVAKKLGQRVIANAAIGKVNTAYPGQNMGLTLNQYLKCYTIRENQ